MSYDCVKLYSYMKIREAIELIENTTLDKGVLETKQGSFFFTLPEKALGSISIKFCSSIDEGNWQTNIPYSVADTIGLLAIRALNSSNKIEI